MTQSQKLTLDSRLDDDRPTTEACPACDGVGALPRVVREGQTYRLCATCRGTGTVPTGFWFRQEDSE